MLPGVCLSALATTPQHITHLAEPRPPAPFRAQPDPSSPLGTARRGGTHRAGRGARCDWRWRGAALHAAPEPVPGSHDPAGGAGTPARRQECRPAAAGRTAPRADGAPAGTGYRARRPGSVAAGTTWAPRPAPGSAAARGGGDGARHAWRRSKCRQRVRPRHEGAAGPSRRRAHVMDAQGVTPGARRHNRARSVDLPGEYCGCTESELRTACAQCQERFTPCACAVKRGHLRGLVTQRLQNLTGIIVLRRATATGSCPPIPATDKLAGG